jgi:hypothetical protein
MLRNRIEGKTTDAGDAAPPTDGGGILDQLGSIVGTIFGTNTPRGRLSTGQVVARNVARTVTNTVIGGIAADLGKSVGGALGGSVGRSIVRGTLGGLLRR